MWRDLFSLSVKEGKYFSDKQAKIELASCPRDKEECLNQLAIINKCFLESHRYHLNKDYRRSIEALKFAFNTTHEIQESSCLKCAELFRLTITQSLENIHEDLQKMITGWFRTKRYQSSFELATLVLGEFRKEN